MAAIWLGAAFVAVFAALTAGLLLWLRAADRKLARLVDSVAAMEEQVKLTAAELAAVAKPAAQTMRTVQDQMAGAARLLEAAERLGDATTGVSRTVSRLSGAISATAERHLADGGKYRKQIEEALGLAEAGYAAWQFWQAKRKEPHASACSGYGEGHDNNKAQ
ncbi:hypothetical protein [Paenibacillus humicola]|uniref:hypothetical protein n=1 Tax=Paenibacillus humicola TaxID=3110540 RepID=UPI00237C1E26|nr:hypothetical protein [Paenibacillus humicola]